MDDLKKVQSNIHFVEAWTVTKAWKSLSDKEQQVYLDGLTAPIESMLINVVEIISWGVNDKETDQRADYDFLPSGVFQVKKASRLLRRLLLNQTGILISAGEYKWISR